MRISDGSSDVCSSDLEEARVRIAQDGLSRARITWIEDVRKWHPGQDWIWKPGGFGVFDPGINALSLASLLFPGPLTVSKAELDYPSNSDTPIAAILSLMTTDHVPIAVILNWRTEGEERWEKIGRASCRERVGQYV